MFEGFESRRLAAGGGREVFARIGGDGPPLLLIHGYPQTHVMWHAVAPALAERFTVVAVDLPGYGASDRPPVQDDHVPHSKRAWAASLRTAMADLGHEHFAVCGHDRGARVTYRMALDHPEAVSRLAVLDIVPTSDVYDHASRASAAAYFHWYFLIQAKPLPEGLITPDPDHWFEHSLMRMTDFEPEAMEAYRAGWRDAAAVEAMCEDYRAGFYVDYEIDRADRDAGRRIEQPVLALWGSRGPMPSWFDMLEVWRPWCADLRGHAVDATHFLAEDRPEEVADDLIEFFDA